MRLSGTRWRAAAVTVSLVLLALLTPLPVVDAAPQERHITVSARSFAFEPGTVRVNRGDTVVLTLEATDVVHGLYLDDYNISTVAEPGRPTVLRFVATQPGAFRFRCSISCGSMHPFMIGKLVVGPNLVWLRAALATVIAAVGAIVVFWPR
jgi:cytochrome c oxidase subunit 2